MELTTTQQKAVETVGTNVCVSAGAGTGKTRVLVERFIHLVREKLAKPAEILTITFTEKAAQEMKERITKRLRDEGLEEARRELEIAYIGTIHSFCARILKEHPIEAEVDPGFRVVEEDEANLLQERVLDELIEDQFQKPEIFDLLRIYGEEDIRDGIKSILEKVHMYGIPSLIRGEEFKSKVLEALEPLKVLKGRESDCAELETLLEESPSWEWVERLKKVAARFRRQGKAKDVITAFRDVLEDWIAVQVESLGERTKNAFLKFASDFELRYRQRKEELGYLDFNDLERKAVQFLSGEELRARALRHVYQNRFKFIMVDEFQDTSLLQDRLISLVAGESNLFIVGDWKQSIYGFRGAEPSIFLRKEKAFSPAEKGERIALVENFRSKPVLLKPINEFFKGLWLVDGLTFEPLVPISSPLVGEEFKENPAVEFLTIERKEDESITEARIKEAQILAERIQALVHSGAYDYRDFAMLFRVATDIYFYEHELRKRDIPYFVISGRGFYKQPEIRDLISFLEFLENPHLDIPLAAVLRSPLVQVSDDTLFWLASASKRINKEIPLYHAFLKSPEIAEIGEKDQKRLESFRTFFLKLLDEKEKWTISECIEQILEHTQYDRYVLSLPQGKRHFANLRKLLEVAREVEARERIHLGDFVRYVKGLGVQEVRESEAQVEALEGNVVKLMTVHKAKGLEFKVVIIPDLNRKGETRSGKFLLDPEEGFGFKVFNEETRDFEATLAYRKIRNKIIENARAESKRLLYVGMTRAKDRLLLSGTSFGSDETEPSESHEDTNWYEWLSNWIAGSPEGVERKMVVDQFGPQGRQPLPLADHKKIRRVLGAGETFRIKTPEAVGGILKRLKPIEPIYFERIDLPVSAFSTFAKNPEEYRLTYELGALPEEVEAEKIEEWDLEEDETGLSPKDFGTVVHQIFEHLVSKPERAKKRLPDLVHQFANELEPNDRETIYRLSDQFLNSKQFSEIKNAKARYAELPFVFRLRGGIIQGTLDLLYQTGGGKWVILDYKTSELSDRKVEEVANSYKMQLMLYALACHDLLHISPSRATLYFAKTDQTYDFPLEGIDFANLKSEFERLQKEIITQRKAWISS